MLFLNHNVNVNTKEFKLSSREEVTINQIKYNKETYYRDLNLAQRLLKIIKGIFEGLKSLRHPEKRQIAWSYLKEAVEGKEYKVMYVAIPQIIEKPTPQEPENSSPISYLENAILVPQSFRDEFLKNENSSLEEEQPKTILFQNNQALKLSKMEVAYVKENSKFLKTCWESSFIEKEEQLICEEISRDQFLKAFTLLGNDAVNESDLPVIAFLQIESLLEKIDTNLAEATNKELDKILRIIWNCQKGEEDKVIAALQNPPIDQHNKAVVYGLPKLQRICEEFISNYLVFSCALGKEDIAIEKVKNLQITYLKLVFEDDGDKARWDKDLSFLSHFKKTLQHLELDNPSLTDDDLVNLKGFPLRVLKLENCFSLTGKGLQHLKGMPLTELDLGGCWNLREGLEHLEGLPIESLDLSGKFVNDDFKHLQKLPLKKLALSHLGTVTNECFSHLKKMPLEFLDLSYSKQFTNEVLAYLSEMPLQELNLILCDWFTPQGIKYLEKLPLKKLHLWLSSIPTEALANLTQKGVAIIER